MTEKETEIRLSQIAVFLNYTAYGVNEKESKCYEKKEESESYDQSHFTHRKLQKAKWQHKNGTPKKSITQRLLTCRTKTVK